MLSDLMHRLRSLVRRRAVEQELEEELNFHRERLEDRFLAEGLTHDEATRRARLAMGGFDQIREEHRDARGVRLVEDLGHDIRYALRQAKRSPGFTVLAVICLGLGIGANASIFSAVNSVLFRPLSVANPSRLVRLARGPIANFSYPDFQDLQARQHLLSGVVASLPMESDLDVDGVSQFVTAEVVSANYGALIGAAPVLGRWFTSDTDPFAVISYAVWQNRFGGSANVLGRRIGSEAQSYTIIGVAPQSFTGVFAPYRTDLWVPVRTRPTLAPALDNRSGRLFMLFGRLGPDATPRHASAELNGIEARLVSEYGAPTEPQPPIAADAVRGIPNPGGRRLASVTASLLMIVVGLVLLIACVNVGTLLLIRASVRRRELAVRRALGATQSRLLRQLLTESLLLAVGGGVTGIVLAAWTTKLLERVLPSVGSTFPVELNLSLDWRVIGFASVLSLATTLACGLLPAWRGSQLSGVVGFKGQIGRTTHPRRPVGLVTQVALSFVLLLLAGSVIETLHRLQVTDPGFSVNGRLYAYVYFPSARTPDAARALYRQALDRLRALPGVLSASQASALPLAPSGTDCVSAPGGPQLRVSTDAIALGYFQTMGIRLVAGRDFTLSDLPRESPTVIVTESLAKRMWSKTPAIGRRVVVGCKAPQASVVIGVVRDSAVNNIGEPPQPRVYRPFDRQYSGGLAAMLLETGADPAAMVPTVRETMLAMGHNVRVYAVEPLGTYIDHAYTGTRWTASVLSGFGLLALALAAIGLYGVMAYRVSLRTQEIGVRMALGAARNVIFRDVVLRGLMIAASGVVIGEVLAVPASRALASVEVGARAPAPSIHVIAVVLWIAVAFIACYVPASRASRVDPMKALRHD